MCEGQAKSTESALQAGQEPPALIKLNNRLSEDVFNVLISI